MKKTVLITGTSSGIGRATAVYFASKGWNVIATQRSPEKEKDFTAIPQIDLWKLDVNFPDQIRETFEKIKKEYGRLDAVVNNAGYAVDGVFEAMSDEVIQKQFDTNVFGVMRITREAIRMMRPQGYGKIIQISSMGGKLTFPFYSIYHSTKFAIEGFTESLHYELKPFGIQLKLIEPGLIATEFAGRSRVFIEPKEVNDYHPQLAKFSVAAEQALKNSVDPELVAEAIFNAANDDSQRLRYPVGAPAPMLLLLRKILPDKLFIGMIKKTYKM